MKGEEYSRREFLGAVAGGASGVSFTVPGMSASARLRQGSKKDQVAALEDYPLRSLVSSFRENVRGARSLLPTGLTKRNYLHLIDGIVRFFADHQDADGAIIDPYEQKERQYATPAFACAAAILYSSGYNRGVLGACLKAMDAATSALAAGKTADNHPDFFTVMLVYAYNALRGRIPDARRQGWARALSSIKAERIYRYQPDGERLHNWNLVAASGEWMRVRARLGGDRTWVDNSLSRQMEKFTPYGMYRDPNDPLAYDHFARYYTINLLQHGYDGPHATALKTLMERGAWTSLFMQSPHGELPCGGRSAHHQWNEAQQAMTYEVYAARCRKRADEAGAGAFKRAARLALGSVARWRRESGELWIVKNRFDPALRHGYEGYSFHSQYNLLTAAKLAVAYLHADDRIAERPCPAEVGGFSLLLQPAFHKVFANAGGMYLEIDTRADPAYNPTGLLRIHHPRLNPQFTLSDGSSARARYRLPARPSRSLSVGPAWRGADGGWESLADQSADSLKDATIRVHAQTPERVEFEVVYTEGQNALRGGATAVRQEFVVTPSRIEIRDSVEGDISGLRSYFPLVVTDGAYRAQVELSPARVSVHTPEGGAHIYEVLGESTPLARLEGREPFRNGILEAAYAETRDRSVRYAIAPRPGRSVRQA